ncbi:MAG: aminotransferase class III-fold pyridoxal phosphate-dependent enzyme [Dermatophilaceae bacterium]
MTDEPLTDSRLGDLLAFDRAHVWHPYSSALTPQDPYLVESAAGVRLRLRLPDGSTRECIDAMSSWWCAIHGYAVPELDAAARSQLDRMSHVMFGGLTHEPAIALARRLVDVAPRHTGDRVDARSPLQHVFFADSGSVAIEVAMKMALQVHVADGRPRRRFFTIRGGYHGDTFSPMSVTDPDGGMHSLWRGILPEHVFAPHPPAPGEDLTGWESQTRALYAAHAADIAAVIVEPILQGRRRNAPSTTPTVVQVLAELARESGALVHFRRDRDRVRPDRHDVGRRPSGRGRPTSRAVGKALTGGYLTLSAVLCTTDVAARVSGGEAGGLMHGPTFMANPLACAIAGASLDLLARDPDLTHVARIGRALTAGLAPARALDSVRDVRVRGAVGVIQLREPVRGTQIAAYAVDRGVWVRPFRDLVYTMPPYVTTDEDLSTLTGALVDAVAAVHG